MKKILSLILGLLLLGCVVCLGVLAIKNPSFVVLFGLMSAVGVPISLSLIGYGFKKKNEELFKKLSKIPQIEILVAQAKTEEEKLRLLKKERDNLAKIIKLETGRQVILDRLNSLGADARRIILEFDSLHKAAREIDLKIGKSLAVEEIKRLRNWIRRNELEDDIVIYFGKKMVRLRKSLFDFPFGGFLLSYLKLIETLMNLIYKI